MKDLRSRVMQLMNRKDPDEAAIQTLTVIMREFGLGYNELRDLPMVAYSEMINVLLKEQKEREKNSKGGKRKFGMPKVGGKM